MNTPAHRHPSKPDVPIHPEVRAATPTWRVALIVLLSWVQAAAQLWLLVLVGHAIDAAIAGRAPGSFLPSALLALALAAIAAALEIWATDATSAQTRQHLRRLVIEKIFSGGAVRAESQPGDLFSLATRSVDSATRYRGGFLGPIIGALSTPVVVLILLGVWIDWLAALVVLGCLVLVPVIVRAFRQAVASVGGSYQRTKAALTRSFLEAIQSLEMLVYNRAAQRVGDDLAARGEENRSNVMRMLAVNQLLIFVVDAAFSLLIIVVATLMAVLRLEAGAISTGQALSLVLASLLVTGPVNVIGQFFYIGIGGRANVSAISKHLGTADHTYHPNAEGEGLEVTHLSGGWPGAEPIIQDLSLHIRPGERVVLIGPSGSGKSTASALIQGHLRPAGGSVRIGGGLAVVEQHTFLFYGTVEENLRLAAPQASVDKLKEALRIAGLEAEVELNTPVGERGRLLSGGQAQRLAIARAWLADAPVLLLDEPTSQVDLAGEAAILAALDRVAAQRAVLMIAHRPDAILSADRVVEI